MKSRIGLALCLLIFGVSSFVSGHPLDTPTPGPSAKTDTTATAAKDAAAPKKITVVGRLTKEGVECRALREDKTNKLFTLTGKVPYKNGTHVKVTGTIPNVSICQQGITIAVTSITKV